MAYPNSEPEFEIEQQLEALKAELSARRKSEQIKDSMIIEYRQALGDAQYALAKANGQLKLANQPTA